MTGDDFDKRMARNLRDLREALAELMQRDDVDPWKKFLTMIELRKVIDVYEARLACGLGLEPRKRGRRAR